MDAGYSFLNMDVSTGILDLFEFSGEPERLHSVYASSIHNVNFAVRATPAQRVKLHLAYNLTKDTAAATSTWLSPSDRRSRFKGRIS